jgi:hypothetical protein
MLTPNEIGWLAGNTQGFDWSHDTHFPTNRTMISNLRQSFFLRPRFLPSDKVPDLGWGSPAQFYENLLILMTQFRTKSFLPEFQTKHSDALV